MAKKKVRTKKPKKNLLHKKRLKKKKQMTGRWARKK